MGILVFVGLGTALLLADLEAFGFGMAGSVGLAQFFCVPILGLALVLIGMKRARRRMVASGVACFAASVTAMVASSMIVGRQEEASRALGDDLCRFLDSWRSMHGSYPDRLEDLVPSLIEEIPATSMGVLVARTYRYSVDPGKRDYWLTFESTLGILCSRGSSGGWLRDD